MNIFSGLEKIVERDYPLAKHTWYGLGGGADYFIIPDTLEQLQTVAHRCREYEVPIYVLGYGSNLLISDEGVRGAVVKLAGDAFCTMSFEQNGLIAGAGADLGKLVLDSVRKGLGGIEAVTGVPGSVGGSVKMNAGGTFGDIGAAVESVTLMDKEGNVFEKSKPELAFDYRYSNITAKFILSVKFGLVPSDPDQLLRSVKEVWIYKKNAQPLNTHNAGCIFKNPRGMSAGAVIDRAGLKGLQIGDAMVSEKHGNFIIAEKGCKSADVKQLIETVRQRVKESLDIELELEVEIW
jgi:UDP-N-acetylmuramate dehydrogenase